STVPSLSPRLRFRLLFDLCQCLQPPCSLTARRAGRSSGPRSRRKRFRRHIVQRCWSGQRLALERTDSLALSPPHRQSRLAVEPVNALAIDLPAFAPQPQIDAPVASLADCGSGRTGADSAGITNRQSPAIAAVHIPGMGLPIRELKKRKKLEPTSTAVPAASAASICREDVIPALPSGIGQSLGSRMRTGLTSHQMGLAFTRLLSTT